jgi:hypothetical protein
MTLLAVLPRLRTNNLKDRGATLTVYHNGLPMRWWPDTRSTRHEIEDINAIGANQRACATVSDGVSPK